MYRNSIQHSFAFLVRKYAVAGLMLFAFTSCHKEGTLQEPPPVTTASIQIHSLETSNRYLIYVDGKRMGDTIAADGKVANYRVEKRPEAQRIEVKDIHGTVFMDTSIVLPAPAFSYLLYQLTPGGKPVIFAEDDGEALPGADSVKWRFLYVHANLPDSIKFRFYYLNPADYQPEIFDSVIAHRGQASEYVAASVKKYSGNVEEAYYGLEVVDAKTGNMIQKLDMDSNSPRFPEGYMLEVILGGRIRFPKITFLLEFGNSPFQSDTYYEVFLLGSDK